MIQRYLQEIKYKYTALGSLLDSALETISELNRNVDQLLYLIDQKERQDASNSTKNLDNEG